MTIAIASGKGGTGKTTVAVNLARIFESPVQLLDCDVEEPNVQLFLKGESPIQEIVTIPMPEVDASLCNACGECSRVCVYNAIVALNSPAIVFPELCRGCCGCILVCPQKAIRETERRIGVIEVRKAGNITLIEGRLDVGGIMASFLIRRVKSRLQSGIPAIMDASPGTSCPVIATLRGSDYVLLVTEPTPFGLHDLALSMEVVGQLKIPFGVVISRVGIGDDRVHTFCRDKNIPILLEIPDDRRIAEAYSRGDLVVDAFPEYRAQFKRLLEQVSGSL
jgi:MinD superfamily P-loop ATPase